MDFRIQHGPVFTILEFDLNEAETVVAQPDSMLSMSSGIQLTASIGRGQRSNSWWSGTKSLLGGESFFTANFKAKRDAQSLILAPESHGDILKIALQEGEGYFLTRGAYLASIEGCELQTRYGGMKGLMAKTGLFLLHASGTGTVFCQTYGAILEKSLAADEQFLIDNRFVVAFTDTLRFELVKASKSLRDSWMSGEGLLNRYTGPGRVFYQTRAKPTGSLLAYILNAST